MKKILILILLISSNGSFAQLKKSALFIGNSYTNYNNLPNLVQQMATSVGDTLIRSAHTPGGAQLVQHASNPTVVNLIANSKWDFVVLQEQSQKPSFSPSQVANDVFPYAKILCDTMRYFDSCTQPIFYMTWGRKFGDAGNCAALPWLCTYQGMDSALAVSYNTMGQQNDAFVSPVGAVWNYLINNNPTLNLYNGDNSHPNINGSYAAACTFYSIIFKKDPTAITFNSSLSNTDAQLIRNAVKTVCFDSLSKWNVGNFDPVANFSYNRFGTTITTTNTSVKSTSYLWDFGDGNTSGLFSPTHNYAGNGTYQVQLIATKCGISDTITQTVSINPSGLNEENRDSFKLYPNPSKTGVFTISFSRKNETIKVYDTFGKLIENQTISSSQKLDLSHLAKGVYFVKLSNNKVQKIFIVD